ncbi:MAG: divergent polysaccharide deacetylase family protein, partial [Methylococcales bacterium]|nr:divergent polysaccharide deacetylase family protein [Methylococcales bacterium]
ELAKNAFFHGKDVLAHIPMQSFEPKNLGKDGLTWAMDKSELTEKLIAQIAEVPHAIGMNNHMGSLLTQDRESMQWVVAALQGSTTEGMFFLDSRTTKYTVAEAVAFESGLATARRDVFFDHTDDEQVIKEQFQSLVSLAKEKGFAIGIGHPKRNTLKVLLEVLSQLDDYGVVLVPLSKQLLKKLPIPEPLQSSGDGSTTHK